MLDAHDTIVTYGENYGEPDCGVPLVGGYRYLKTRQPIDLELWPVAFDDRRRPTYTTIGNWKQKGHDVAWNGETYPWSKHHEFLKFLDLPRRRPGQRFELCLNVDDEADRRRLRGERLAALEPAADVPRPLRLPGASSGARAPSGRWPRTRTCACRAAGSASATPATWPPASR